MPDGYRGSGNPRSIGDERAEKLEDDLGRTGDQVSGRLVAENEGRVVGDGAGDGGALLLTAAHPRGQLVEMVAESDLSEQGCGPLAVLHWGIPAGEFHRQHHVIQQGHRRQQGEELEDDTERSAAPAGTLCFAHAVDGLPISSHKEHSGAGHRWIPSFERVCDTPIRR